MCQMGLPQHTNKLSYLLSLKHRPSLLALGQTPLGDSVPLTFAAMYTATLLEIHRKQKMFSNSQIRKSVS